MKVSFDRRRKKLCFVVSTNSIFIRHGSGEGATPAVILQYRLEDGYEIIPVEAYEDNFVHDVKTWSAVASVEEIIRFVKVANDKQLELEQILQLTRTTIEMKNPDKARTVSNHKDVIFRHYKNNFYKVLQENVILESSGELMTVYQGQGGKMFCRPSSEFHGYVEHEVEFGAILAKVKVKRFEMLELAP